MLGVTVIGVVKLMKVLLYFSNLFPTIVKKCRCILGKRLESHNCFQQTVAHHDLVVEIRQGCRHFFIYYQREPETELCHLDG